MPSTLLCRLSALYFFLSTPLESECVESRWTSFYCQLDPGAHSLWARGSGSISNRYYISLSLSFLYFSSPMLKKKKKQYKLGHFFSVGPVFPAQVEVQGMWAKLARLQTQRQSSSLLFSSVCMPLTHGSDLVYVFEMSHSPNLWTLFREWALSWLDPVWLTRRNAFTRSFFFFFFWSHDTHLQQHFWFIGLISLRWWSTKDVKQNLQRVFYGVFHRYVCLVEDLLSHAHADGETCTCGYREDTYHSLRLEVFHDFHSHRIICPRFPRDKCKNISAWFNEYHKIMCCPKLRSIWFHVLGNSQTHCKLVRKAHFKGELWSFKKKFKLRILRRL